MVMPMMGQDPTPEHLRAWLYEPDAFDKHGSLGYGDDDSLLWNWRFVPQLIDAAADPQCPEAERCYRMLTDYAMHLVSAGRRDQFGRLADTAAAATGRPGVDDWARHVDRMLRHANRRGPVNRAAAEQMAADLMVRPWWYTAQDGVIRASMLRVRVADTATHWVATWDDHCPDHLYINRRTGAYRHSRIKLSADQLRAVH
jgi:hypothetical protein